MAEFADTTNQKAQIGIRSKAQTTQVMTAIMWCTHSIVYHCQTVSDAIEIHQHVFQRSVANCAKDERLPALNDSSALPFMGAIFCNKILALPSMGGMVSWCPVGLGTNHGTAVRIGEARYMDGLRTCPCPDRDQDMAEYAGFPDMNPARWLNLIGETEAATPVPSAGSPTVLG